MKNATSELDVKEKIATKNMETRGYGRLHLKDFTSDESVVIFYE